MYSTAKHSGLCVVAPSGITGTKSLSINTGKCLATAQTLGAAQSIPTSFNSCKGHAPMPVNTSYQLVRRFNNV
jgi:hypothetical protein